MDSSDRQKILTELFESSTLSRAALDLYLRRALDQRYWDALNPDLSIGAGSRAGSIEALQLDDASVAAQLAKFRREGYFHTSPVRDAGVVGRMRAAVGRLRGERWPAVFCFVYDEFWQVFRTPSLLRLVSSVVGEGFRQNSRVWAFYVAARRGAEGWEPHSDAGIGGPRMSVWVSLTDATVENGCIYVIPHDRLPDDLHRRFGDFDNVTRAQLCRLLQSTRAVPARAGSYLGWDHDLVHWGSVSSGQSEPRISLALEFAGRHVVPQPDEVPVLDPSTGPPSFSERLAVIGQSLLSYEPNEPSLGKYLELARQLLKQLPR